MIFRYTRRETDYLAARDPALSAWIKRIGYVEREILPDPFEALVYAVSGQQVSSKAQATVWARLCARGLTRPQAVRAASEAELAALGLGPKKARWVRQAAARAHALEGLEALDDAQAIQTLVSFEGVGRWTAEMLLIFSLNRMNVLSRGDFGIRRGLTILHGEDACAQFARWKELYTPYGSVASLYLWEIARAGDANVQI